MDKVCLMNRGQHSTIPNIMTRYSYENGSKKDVANGTSLSITRQLKLILFKEIVEKILYVTICQINTTRIAVRSTSTRRRRGIKPTPCAECTCSMLGSEQPM